MDSKSADITVGSRTIASDIQASPAQKKRATAGLFSELYEGLKAVARRELAHFSTETLNATALVHELFLRIAGNPDIHFESNPQLFYYAARAIRHILIDHARHQLSTKATRRALSTEEATTSATRAIQIDIALDALEATQARAARVVELHYFAGLPLHRVAELLRITRRTADRDWSFAKSFLLARVD